MTKPDHARDNPARTNHARPNYVRNIDGIDIAWYDFGGNGPALLLGHATGFCAHVWSPVIDLLQDEFHVFAYDLRGHGNSRRPANRGGWDWHRYPNDVAAVIAAAGLVRPISVGHSCGAATALLLEEASPGTFSAFVGFEPVMFAAIPPTGPDDDRDLAVRTRARRTGFDNREEAITNFSTRGPFTGLHPEALAAYIDHGFTSRADGKLELRCHPEDEASVYAMASAHNGYVDLGRVSPPVTVVRGSESKSFDESTMQSVAARVRNGTLITMGGVGHFGALENPEGFVAIVKDVAGRR